MGMEWRLDPDLLASALESLQEHPYVDLSDSLLNHRFAKVAFYRLGRDAFAIDAFNINWSHLNFYAFPPFCLGASEDHEGQSPRCMSGVLLAWCS